MVLQLLIAALLAMALLFAVGRVPVRYNLRNLALRWKTTIVTAMAFTLVIALLTLMLAFVNGMNRLTENSGHPHNVLVLSDGAPDEAISNLGVADLSEIENLPEVLRENGRPVASRETYLIVNQAFPDPNGGRPRRQFVQLRGLDDVELTARVHALRLLPGGEWFSDAGVRRPPGDDDAAANLIEAVVGEGIARELGRGRTAEEMATARNRWRLDVGDTFTMGNRTWLIVGVLDSSASTFNSEIWAKRSLLGPIFGKDTYTTLVLRCPDVAKARQLKTFLSGSEGAESADKYKKAAVAAQLETDYYASLSQTNKQFTYAIGFVAAIMSVGGIFGVMNTMFAAISQRVKDIGVLRLLGYSRLQILISFLLESLAIGLLGGILGCAVGSLCDGWSATSVISSGAGAGKTVAMKLAVDGSTLAIGIVLTLVMATLGGLLPATLAMRMRALEALR